MQPFERWIILRKFLHWHSISHTRGKAFRLLRETTKDWRRCAKQQKNLRENEKRARRAIRVCRINCTLELCLTKSVQSRIKHAAEIGRWLEAMQPAHVPMVDRLDHLILEEGESMSRRDRGTMMGKKHNVASNPKKLYIQGKAVPLLDHDMTGLLALKYFHWLLSQLTDNMKRSNSIHTTISPQNTQIAASPIDRLKNHLKNSGKVDFCNDIDNPTSIPDIHIIELIVLADEIQHTLKKFNKSNPGLNVGLLQQCYISNGSEDSPSSAPHIRFQTELDDENADRQAGTGAICNHIGLNVETNDFFDIEEGQSFAKYLAEISTAENDGQYAEKDAKHISLVDAIATSAKTNLSIMKVDMRKSLIHAQSSQIHLVDYREFLEKKKKQRIQCLRDIQTHCCKCRGPHISKPPFNHGKAYRREPLHNQHQGEKCLFLKKKRAELKWLDETLGNYSKKNERFEREIEKRTAETLSRKENMKDALANSLRLMEMASL
mmetsp:Transcript_36331/g.78434  ORF Transcript_36331/g.78434 Transcript_36331/m.78434 type:complete len:491 (-) Transcript_36331:50-1522(-)